MNKVALGFVPEPKVIRLDKILPSRKLPENISLSRKYRQILESIRLIGLIEPLMICQTTADSDAYLLLDGHIRIHAMRELELIDSTCLIATDDESYTYNNRVNRLSTIQEHLMIKRAISRGVPPEKLAKSLDIDLTNIIRKARLLDGVCSEAADLLRDQVFSVRIGGILRKMKPTRQIECVELMLSANNITITYAEALLAASPPSMLSAGFANKKVRGVNAEQMQKMAREMGNLHEQYKIAEESYGQDVLNLVLARGFLIKILDNPSISQYIKQFEPDFHAEFINIIQTTALDS